MQKKQTVINKYKSLPISVRAGIWFTICNVLQKGISFITMPIFTRIMTTEEYGIYTVYNSWYSIIVIFATLNLSSFVFSKGLVKYKENREELQLSFQGLNCTITIALFILYLCFHNSINEYLELSTAMMFLMFLQLLFEPTLQYWTVKKRFEYDYRKVVLVTLLVAMGGPIIGVFLVIFSTDAALSRVFATVLVTAITSIILAYRNYKSVGKRVSTKYWGYALRFNLPLIPHFLSSSILNQADRIMINSMVGSTSAAIYSVAYSIAMVPMLLSTAIQQSFLPWLYQKMSNKDCKNVGKVTNITLLIMMGVVIVLISFGPELIRIVAPLSYYEARWVIPPVCASAYFVFLYNMFANIEYYFEETKIVAIASVIVAFVNIAFNHVFIGLYGFVAAGYTTLACYVAFAISHYFVVKYICKKHKLYEKLFDIKNIIFISSVFLIFTMIITVLYDLYIIRYGIIILLCMICIIKRNSILNLIETFRENK